GFELGSRHLRHHQLVDYARYLARKSDRVALLPYGQTHGLRPLLVLMITSDADSLDLDAIRKDRRKLASGRAKKDSLDDQKVVGYFGYCVHGDEASAANAFPAIAYYLAAARNDAVDDLLKQSVLLLDPALNPDGVDRFANWVNENRGRYANPSAIDREHNQPWPGGRTNYYWFDLNRDWLPTVHPESQGRIKLFHQWKPNLVLDFHEMGSTSSYFFQPGIPERNNPLTPQSVFDLTRKFAREHASSLDAADELYFSEERFDDFYMGKGSTYPDLHGAIGILFEQGSTRGLRSKNDRYDRTFGETVANQIRTSLSSLRMLGKLKTEMLQHQTTFFRESLALASQSPIRAYILHADGDRSRVQAAAKMMRRHDITVWIPDQDINVNGNRLAAGTAAVIPTDQPEYRFLESLMRRTQKFRENIFYDVSAWTTPLAFDLNVLEFTSDLPDGWKSNQESNAKKSNPNAASTEDDEAIAYSIDPVSLETPRLVGKLLRNGVQVRVAYEPFQATIAGTKTEVRRGSWLVLKAVNQSKWKVAKKMIQEAIEDGVVPIQRLTRGLTPFGPDLGSNSHLVIPKPEVCLVVGEATSGLDAGSIWHTFDTRFGIPVTLIDGVDLLSADLDTFSVIVLPSGSYRGLDSQTAEHLQRYVRSGGTVVAIASAIRKMKEEGLVDNPVGPTSGHDHDAEQNKTFAGASDRAALERIAGAFFSTEVDQTHPLAFGFPDRSVPVFRTSTTAHPTPDNKLGVAATYTETIAGYVSDSNREKLLGTAAVWAENYGRGRVICIADSPTFRGYIRSTERFLSNAILIGPVLSIPSDIGDEEEASGHGHHHH
ncbi:MAG: M14 family metallopeptidase, partial [Planctomycetota bacterium]